MRICLLGTQGTGKTTLVNLFRDKYDVIDGVARSCIAQGFNSSESGDVRGQRAIFSAYQKALDRDNFISTRSLIDVVAYTNYLDRHRRKDIKGIRELAIIQTQKLLQWYEANPDVIICYVPVEIALEDDGVRSTNLDYQMAIDYEMRDILYSHNIKYYTIKGTIEERKAQLQHIVDKISNGVENHIIKDF